jgi:hypothetical protein
MRRARDKFINPQFMKTHAEKEAERKQRVAIEAKRGIVRDAQGIIIRSTDWKRERIAFLKSKAELYKARIKNATATIQQLQASLEE